MARRLLRTGFLMRNSSCPPFRKVSFCGSKLHDVLFSSVGPLRLALSSDSKKLELPQLREEVLVSLSIKLDGSMRENENGGLTRGRRGREGDDNARSSA
eukprot:CAMPEP_0182825974 /NCGR_PEP_ID=MMETSP0006_2-20121128/16128_1 /TAXON_ID=97485 /ORGANISM="Prymnesium parvum, Strain Texoma1" /LENGTH=98 /DNA_ID=CAMNT_0024953111 /DNA_START=536 /DNA_END=832 /DNA_ORIENTATION=-